MKDIFGNTVLSVQGIYNKQNMQIHVIQGFNLIDQIYIDSEIMNKIDKEDANIESIKNTEDISDVELMIVLFMKYLAVFSLNAHLQ